MRLVIGQARAGMGIRTIIFHIAACYAPTSLHSIVNKRHAPYDVIFVIDMMYWSIVYSSQYIILNALLTKLYSYIYYLLYSESIKF